MSLTQFKLSKPGGLTRRLTFGSRPSWSALSSRIGELYEIPIEKIAVSYIDNDGDEVTLSSEEELQEFYKTPNQPQPIKFGVQDLRSLRSSYYESSKALPDTPLAKDNLRNTFGGVFDLEDDWQLPTFGTFRRDMIPESPHAFLEVVESDVTGASEPSEDGSHKPNDPVLPDLPPQDHNKGKEKAYEPSITDTVSSTGSVLAEDAPPKPPVHVYDINSREKNQPESKVSTPSPIVPTSHSPNHKIVDGPTESTPKATIQSLTAADARGAEEITPDPPLPSLDMLPTQTPTPSLSHDVATLLDTLSRVISSHPELSEGIRNIVRNATSGEYWHAHRQAIASAAQEIARTAQEGTGKAAEEVRRIAEDEAGRRVTAALGEIFRMFSGVTGPGDDGITSATNTAPAPAVSENPVTPSQVAMEPPLPPRPPPGFPGSSSWYTGRSGLPGSSGWGPPPPVPPQISGWSRPPFVPRGMEWRPWWNHTLPATGGPPHHPSPLPPLHMMPPPVPPFPTLPGPPPPPPSGPSPPSGDMMDMPPPLDDPAELTEQELRAKVELAKQKYKAEKELYRLQREERRKDRERKRSRAIDNFQDATPAKLSGDAEPAMQIVSNARGPYPQLEMVSVPTKRNRELGGLSGRRNPLAQTHEDDGETEAIQRITSRLADMGFMTKAYPTILTRIKAHMPLNSNFGKDVEDDIVTTMLEELLAMSPKPPVASGSGLRKDRDIPGAWH